MLPFHKVKKDFSVMLTKLFIRVQPQSAEIHSESFTNGLVCI